ncbi:MAG TPA: hypothetical protein VJX67_17385 [Blastocatellia bacterium]|nr:hypothetical protein [Blastocatellia bacterium]
MNSSLKKILLDPIVPNTAASFSPNGFVVVDLRRSHSGLVLASSAMTEFAEGLINPGFEPANITDQQQVIDVIRQTAEAAGLGNRTKWSVALPEGVARTLVVTLEGKPSSRRELEEVISWKIERSIGSSINGVKVSRQRLHPASGMERYVVTAVRESVLLEYETLFNRLGWHVGLLLPKHLAEAQWLIPDPSQAGRMLVSAGEAGFTSIVVQNGEPALVRTHECDAGAVADELYRVALFYRDRLAAKAIDKSIIESVLVVGGIDRELARSAIADATGNGLRLIDPADFGLDLKGEPISFDQIAAAAGLSNLATR